MKTLYFADTFEAVEGRIAYNILALMSGKRGCMALMATHVDAFKMGKSDLP